MKRISSKIFAVVLALGILGCATTSKISFTPGTYQGSAPGFNGDVTIEVTVDSGRILGVRVVSQNDTPEISGLAYQRIPQAIVEGQTLGVDMVSGASISSKGIIEAATAALAKSGADIKALQSRKPVAAAKRTSKSETADVVVIGAGGAGLAAAITASQNGAKVIVLEKMPRAGGNTIISGAAWNAADAARQASVPINDANRTAIQQSITRAPHDAFEKELQATITKQFADFNAAKKTSIFDSPEFHMLQTYNGGDYVGNPELIKTLASGTLAALEWEMSMGLQVNDHIFTVAGGLWPRAHQPTMPLGTGYIDTDLKYIDAHKDQITLLVDTKATELIVQNGRVTGVKAAGPTTDYTFTAAKGVILATGGFGANKELRQKYGGAQWGDMTAAGTTNHPGATGDGLLMAETVEANLVGMEYIQFLPLGDPVTGSLSGNIEQGVEDRFFVNKEGNRFVDEGGRRDAMTKALFAQPDALMWIICDKHSYPTPQVKNNFNETIEELIQQKRAFGANTIEELAQQIGVPPANLKAAVDEFNAGVDSGKDRLGRTLWKIKIDTPPYYAGARIPTVHHTMGGLQINTQAQVINKSGQVIPGLYAAGEVTGGIHGSNRLGGNALADIHVFGRIAGASAVAGK
ncbi:flavocytochrome c [Spirochaetia bacterium]|nr:flavocytochrome c [Spirochaetia bacterium]